MPLVFLYGAVILSEAENLIACLAFLNALAFLYGAVILSKVKNLIACPAFLNEAGYG